MSIALAFSFELGLALSLASILLSDKNKKQTLPWILMSALTLVQVCGNVYSVFKFISESNADYYQYLAKPLLFFIQEVDENTIQVIVSWIMGAILPIVALMMTDMVATNIQMQAESEKLEDPEEQINEDEIVEEPVEKKEEPKENKVEIIEKPVTTEVKEFKVDKVPEVPFPVETPSSEEFTDAEISKPKEDESDFTEGTITIPTVAPEEKEDSSKDTKKKSSIKDTLKNLVKPIILPNNRDNGTYHASENYFKSPEVNK